MKHLYLILTTLVFALFGTAAFGQFSFSDQSSLLENQNVTSGVAIGVADMNGDGLDDILRMSDGSNLMVEYQSADAQPFTSLDFGPVSGSSWAIAAADMNNDGYCDIMTGGAYNNVKVLTNMAGTDFSLGVVANSNIFVQGSNFADIDNDGSLDIFACHDDGESRIFAGDGLGNFTSADDWIDMATTPASDNSGNYGSMWTDFDNDRDLDLYIAKCRIGVTDQNDPRRINALFVNDGENNYSEEAGKYGLKIKYQSWTADFGDIDNDGDLDCFITNHDHSLQILENDGAGHFKDISMDAGVGNAPITEYVQGIMRDLDNDGFIDLVVAQPPLFFRNNGDKTFTEMFPISADFGSVAAGDLNHDGFVDLFVAHQNGFNNPSNTPDKIWMNDGNDNHFLTVNLQGMESNRSGVGARIEIHGPWGIQIREVRAGESYGITNSLASHFGLGEAQMVDHVVVHWPSGQMDVLSGVGADQFITIEEGLTCHLDDFIVEMNGDAVLCEGESTMLTAPSGYTYLWSNGSTEQNLTVEKAGNYSLVLLDEDGCAAASDIIAILESPDETPTIEAFGDTEFCEGGDVVLIASEAASYEWSNGEVSENITVTTAGEYFVTVPGACGEFTSESIMVEVLPSAAPVTQDEYIPAAGQTAVLQATGASPHWYVSETSVVPMGIGNTFETPVINEETTFYVSDLNEYGGGEFDGGMPQHQGSNFNGNNFNGQVLFDAHAMFTLKQVTVGTDVAGAREVQLLDANDVVLATKQFDLPLGESVIDLNFVVEAGTGYKLVTNSDVNQSTLGTDSPRLLRSDEGVNYPYEVPDVLTITNSNYGSGFYYYFFDWKIDVPSTDCESERVPATVFIGVNAAQEVLPFGNMSVQPNPSSGLFKLALTAIESGEAHLTISDLRGAKVYSEKFGTVQGTAQTREIDLGTVPGGMYFMKITSGERAGWMKLMVGK